MADEIFKGLEGFAEALERAPAAALESAAIAVNHASEYAESEGRKRVRAKLNLDDAYIRQNLFLYAKATSGTLESRIRANKRTTLATRFGAEQKTEPTSSNRVKGDPSRGIPRGQKGAGSKAWSVLRGGAKKEWRNAFFVKLKGSGAWGMVARFGGGAGLSNSADWRKNLKVIHGFSVDQAWRNERAEVGAEAMALASRKFVEELEKRL